MAVGGRVADMSRSVIGTTVLLFMDIGITVLLFDGIGTTDETSVSLGLLLAVRLVKSAPVVLVSVASHNVAEPSTTDVVLADVSLSDDTWDVEACTLPKGAVLEENGIVEEVASAVLKLGHFT